MAEMILLTGVSGFIAKHVALRLLQAGYAVRGTVRRLDRGKEVRAALAPHLDPVALARLSFVAADLEADAGWAEAVAGVSAVVHTASPFPLAIPKDEQELIRPAVEGTLRVMRAAKAAGIGRVVLTSSVVAVLDEGKKGTQDEADWCNMGPATSAYAKSKTLAERAAWDFARAEGMQLTTINPGLVMGPPLDRHYGSSLGLVERVLRGRDPMLPMIGLACVDVRDVAEMHVRAVQRPATAGKRYLATAGSMTMPDIGRVLKQTYPKRRIPTVVAPKFVLRLMALFDPQIRSILPSVGVLPDLSNARARADMEMAFISPVDALKASAAWLVEEGGV